MIVIKNQAVYAVVIAACFLYSTVLDKSRSFSTALTRPLHAVSPEYIAPKAGVDTTLSTVDSGGVLALRSSIRLNTRWATRRVVCMTISDCVRCGVRTYVTS